jgi:anti-sigma regulatory factor (Ser/Thr protein kinase)
MSERPPTVLSEPMTRGVHSSLRVPADLTVVAFVRSALACVLTREGWPGDGAGRVLLASTEALTNAIEHGSPLGAAVEVGMSVTEDRALIRIADEGRPGSQVPRLPAIPPPSTSVRGRGLLIISRLADGVAVEPNDGGTAVVVEFLRRSAPAAAVRVAAVRAA